MRKEEKMHNLILITSEFPFLSGEPFLLNELPYLSERFNEIYVFSINGRVTDAKTRYVPNNVKCFALGNTVSKLKYVKYIITGLKMTDYDLKISEKNLKRIIASLYTRGRALDITNKIYSIIKDCNLEVDRATVYSFWFAYQAIAAWLLSKKLNLEGKNTMCVSRAHGYDLYWERAIGGYLPFQDVSLRNLNWCFPCSDFGTKYLLEKYPWAVDKIQTKRLGTKDYGLNPYLGEKTFVTCCNLEPLKRISLFAEAFCEVAKNDKLIKWICIGSGEEEIAIKRIIKNAGVTAQTVMTERLSNEKVMDIYKTKGVMYFCNVSTSEGMPVSIMEAMSFGIPIIATNVGGTQELVDEENGELIPAEIDKESLTRILQLSLSADNEEYLLKRKESRMRWESLASAETNYKEFCSMICDE